MAYIYKIENIKNGKVYIGSTKDYKRRFDQHKYMLKNKIHSNKHLQNAWNKYGEEIFKFEIVESVSDDNQFDREQYYIDKYQPYDSKNGYNICTSAKWGHLEYKSGENHHRSEYNSGQIEEAKRLYLEDLPYKYIEQKTGVKTSNIHNIITLKSWIHVGEQYNEKLREKMYFKKFEKDRVKKDLSKAMILKERYSITLKEISEILDIGESRLHDYHAWEKARERGEIINCHMCGKEIRLKSNNQKFCKKCVSKRNKEKQRKYMREQRGNSDKTDKNYKIKILNDNKELIRTFDNEEQCAKYIRKCRISKGKLSYLKTKIKSLCKSGDIYKGLYFEKELTK